MAGCGQGFDDAALVAHKQLFGAGRTGETLGEQAGTGTFLASTRFSSGVSDSELQSWIDSHK